MKRKPLFLLLLGTLLSHAQAATPTGSITIVDQFQPQSTGASSTTNYRLQIGSTQGQALTGVGFTVDLSNAYSQINSFTSNCGGTVTWTGTTATFTGGSIAAASSTTPVLCNVTINGTAVKVPGTKTISVPAQSIVTDQGLTNSNGTASTLTITPLQALTISQGEFQQYNTVTGKSSKTTTFINGSTNDTQTVITNTNSRAITGITLNIVQSNSNRLNDLQYIASESTCTSNTAAPTSASGSGNTVTLTGLTIPANGSCTLITRSNSSSTVDYQGYPEISPSYITASFNMSASITTNDQDSTLNISKTTNLISSNDVIISKLFNDSNSYNIQNDTNTTMKFTIYIRNISIYDNSYSLSDIFPNGISFANSDIAVSSDNATCNSNGITLTDTTLTMSGTVIPASTTCRYDFTVNKPTNLNGSISNSIFSSSITQSNAIYSVGPGTQSGSTAAQAIITSTNPLTISKSSTNSGYKAYGNAYYISFNNTANNTIDNVNFTDSWNHNLLIDTTNSSTSQCGGTVSINSDRKGFTFTGGSVPAASGSTPGSCFIRLYLDPTSATAGTYNNTTSNINTARGTYGVVSNTFRITQQFLIGADPKTLVNGVAGILEANMQNPTAVDMTETLTATIPTGLTIDTSKPVNVICEYNGTNSSSYTLDPANFTVSNGTLSITDTLKAQNNFQNPNRITVCKYYYTATSTVNGSIGTAGRLTYDGNTGNAYGSSSGYTPNTADDFANGLTFNYQTIAGNNYTINKSFDPQTVIAGGDTKLTFTLSNSTVAGDQSSNYSEITDHLPDGMIVSPVNFAPNQSDGSYKSPEVVPNNYPDQGLACVEVSADRGTLISRCRNIYSTFFIRLTKYGDLINTLQPSDVKPFYGFISASASASAKASQGVPLIKSFNPKTLQSGQYTQLSIQVYNAATEQSGINTISFQDPLPAYLSADKAPNVTGNCTGAQATYNTGSNVLQFSGIQLNPNTSCTLTVPIKGLNPTNTTVTSINTIRAASVTSTLGSSNPKDTSDNVTITPGTAQPGITKEQGVCTDSSCTNVTYTQSPINVRPCQYISYRVTFNNTGTGPLKSPIMKDTWPQNVIWKGGSTTSNNILWYVNNDAPSITSPAIGKVQSGDVVHAGYNSTGTRALSSQDYLAPGNSVEIIMKGQIQGVNCQ